MGVYNNNKDGTRSTLANTIQVVDAPMEQFLSRGEFSAVTPNDVSADNKLVDFNSFNTTLKELELIEDIEQYRNDPEAIFVEGAVGDGVTDDSQAFLDAISEGYTLSTSPKIIIPRGKYNLNHVAFDSSVITNSITFIGESAHLCELIDANISAQYGITCKNVAFIGGTQRDFSSATYNGLAYNLKTAITAIWCTPSTNSSIEYKNCIFKGTTAHPLEAASLAYNKKDIAEETFPTIIFDVVENCLFENISYAGVHHRLPIQTGKYINNIFRKFGKGLDVPSSDLFACVCLKAGDTSNSTSNSVQFCTIKNNVFDTMLAYNTANDTDRTGEYNFVTIQGNAVIMHNQFKNLLGYGHDREGLYTKSNVLEITENYFNNAGLGEGYICNKKGDVDVLTFYRYENIHNNVFVGDSGRAIQQYANACIYDNFISIVNAKQAIACNGGETGSQQIEIHDNYISCGYDNFYIDGQLVDTYHEKNSSGYIKDSVIKCTFYDNIYISNNNIVIADNITTSSGNSADTISLITAQSSVRQSIINNNKLFSNNANIGVNMVVASSITNSGSFYGEVKNNLINLNNTVNSSQPTVPIKIYVQHNCDRFVKVINNTILSSSYASYGVQCQMTNANNSNTTLEFDTQQPQLTWKYSSGKHVNTNNSVSYINSNPNWIKLN